MFESEGETDRVRLVLAPRIAAAAAGLSLLSSLARALGFDLERVLALDLSSPVFWLWQLLSYPLVQVRGITGIVGQALMCGALYWVTGELERDIGARRTASFLIASAVGTGLLSFVIANSVYAQGRLAGADVLILASLSAYAWQHPEQPLPGLAVDGLRRNAVLLGLLIVCFMLYAIDGGRTSLIARTSAVLVGLCAWRVDLGPAFDRLIVAGVAAPREGTEQGRLLPALVKERWEALSQRLRGELTRASLPPPRPPEAPAEPAPSGYWSDLDPALPLALVDPLRREP